jgi:DNA-binding CsgD family transcriptional regulator
MRPHNSTAVQDLGFTRAQLWQFNEQLGGLYGARSFAELMESVIGLIRPCFDADYYSVGFTDPRRRRHLAIIRPTRMEYFMRIEQYRQLASQSALLQYWVRTGDHDRVLRRSDCCDISQYRKCALYCEVDRPNGAEQLLGTWLRRGGGQHFEVALARSGRTDFADRDVARLSLLRTHVFRAYRNVCDFQQLPSTNDIAMPGDVMELQDTSLASHVDGVPPANATSLTPREREVLQWIVEGKTNPEIGIILGISWRTVRLHCERIFRKLNVETRTAAAIRARERNLTAPISGDA